MANRPSRRKKKAMETEMNLIPIMNLFMVLIPFLLISAVFIKVGGISIYLPQSGGASSTPQLSQAPQVLLIQVTKTDFRLNGIGSRLPNVKGKNGKHDFNGLSKSLFKLKKSYPDADEVVLLFTQDMPYNLVVKTMDATREYLEKKDDGTSIRHNLFPNVSIGEHGG